ncbi:prostaglandin reductase 1 isoform X2 [Anoplophora glabripennis]|uniref:prostaglandin reductase 1 isoform X2 n=1 Tax=Anoplophora glabripennis TaxID=217634 RepID=UPI000873D0BB|nr:prostaglandin reductase 1 isoform X2 [Anoplophora glabripennis]
MVKAKVFVFEKLFDGLPKEDDLKIVEEELPPIKNGEFLVEAIYLSVDPYMRAYTACHKIGETNVGSQVGKNTAYFGFLEICTPQAGETVVVTGAAGAVGSHVGQIAKIKGCKVIGVTGSDEKGKWLVEELGFDHFINYKTADLDKALDELAPEKIDCYFDNVGGEISSIILRHMNNFGRISVCGSISGYNNKSEKATTIQRPMISLNLTMEGFIVSRWANRWNEGIQQNLKWIKEGKLKYHETVTEGFENMLKAFIELFTGGNVGKAIVKV